MRAARLIGCVLLAASTAVGQPEAKTTDGWEELRRFQNRSAVSLFESLPPTPASRYGLALALIDMQPKTEANLDRAEALLKILAEETRGETRAAGALYHLARIQQVHRAKPDGPAAFALYERLRERYPGHPLAEMAAVKMAILQLYSLDQPRDEAERLRAATVLGQGLTDRVARRDFHLVLADAWARSGLSDAQSLAHLVEVDRAGGVTGRAAADLLVRLGEVSRRLGRTAEARTYFERFLVQFPRDERAYTIRLRMKEIS